MAAYTTIDDSEAYFHTQLFTGDDNADRLITNGASADFRPDLLWLKNRSSVSSQCIFDSLRLASSESTVMLRTNNANTEEDKVDRFGGFETDGFTVDGNDADTNADGDSFVAWQWKANGSGSSNTTGSINTTATSANTTSGFSIITYTGNDTAGATIGHGLGAVPHFIMIKCRSASQSWPVYHHKNTSAPETDFLILDTAVATADASNRWNDTAPTSTLITLGDENQSNGALNYVAYAWTEIQGYSKFGVYKGNGNADGAFVYTGFKPAFLIIKLTSGAGQNWFMFDNKRSPFNINTKNLYADETGAEGTADRNDLISNGFKFRESGAGENGSDKTYVYIAFAEAPFVNSEGVPGNAR